MKILFISGSCWMRDKSNNLLPFIKNRNIIKIFTKFGDELIYPTVYWYEGDYLFPYLEEIVEKEKINLIVGYSAGGHTGFHLCNKYKIKGMHFNPAIAKTSEAPTLQILPDEYKSNSIYNEQIMILGEDDRKYKGGVDSNLVFNYLKSINFDGDILIVPGLEHEVPLSFFKIIFEKYR